MKRCMGELHYLCERAEAYKGIAVMSFSSRANAADVLCLDAVDAIVEFE